MLYVDLNVAVPKQAFSRKSVKESITRNPAFVVRKNLKLQENVNIINVQGITGKQFAFRLFFSRG